MRRFNAWTEHAGLRTVGDAGVLHVSACVSNIIPDHAQVLRLSKPGLLKMTPQQLSENVPEMEAVEALLIKSSGTRNKFNVQDSFVSHQIKGNSHPKREEVSVITVTNLAIGCVNARKKSDVEPQVGTPDPMPSNALAPVMAPVMAEIKGMQFPIELYAAHSNSL